MPVCEQYGVDLLLAGHDHNLQHITREETLDVIMSGAGGAKSLYEYKRVR